MNYRWRLLGAALLLFPLACTSEDEPQPGQETDGVDDDDEPGSTSTPSEDDGSSTGDVEPPTDCSCFLEPMEVEFTSCRDLDEVFPGCAAPAEDCGTFWWINWPSSEPTDEVPAETATALRCTLDALAAGERPGFTWAADPMDYYGGETEYLPLPDGSYGAYSCNTTNEGSHHVSVDEIGDVTGCIGFLDADPLTVEDYDQALECLSEAMGEASDGALTQCG